MVDRMYNQIGLAQNSTRDESPERNYCVSWVVSIPYFLNVRYTLISCSHLFYVYIPSLPCVLH